MKILSQASCLTLVGAGLAAVTLTQASAAPNAPAAPGESLVQQMKDQAQGPVQNPVEMFDGQERPNAARFVFLDPRAHDFYLDWDRIARDVVATLRSAAGRNPYDRELTDLVGELSTRSEPFRQHWAKHDVRFHVSGVKHFRHSQVGDLELNYERLDVAFDDGLTIFAYTADPDTRSAEALSLLGSLAATDALPASSPDRR